MSYITEVCEELKSELCDYEYLDPLNSYEMSEKIFGYLRLHEIHCRLVAYPYKKIDENNLPKYENELEEYPEIKLDNSKILLKEIEDVKFEIKNNILYTDSKTTNFTIENGHLMYDMGNMKDLHWSVLIKHTSGWKDFDYTGMDFFYYPIYSKSKQEKFIIEEYDPNGV